MKLSSFLLLPYFRVNLSKYFEIFDSIDETKDLLVCFCSWCCYLINNVHADVGLFTGDVEVCERCRNLLEDVQEDDDDDYVACSVVGDVYDNNVCLMMVMLTDKIIFLWKSLSSKDIFLKNTNFLLP